jgi:hypothetical protein
VRREIITDRRKAVYKMTKITNNHGLKKGDVVTVKEIAPIYNRETESLVETEFVHRFVIDRVNAKTYTCTYIEGAYKNSGFKWIKNDSIENSKKEYMM